MNDSEVVFAVPFSFDALERLQLVLDEADLFLELSPDNKTFVDRLRDRLHFILNPVVR